MRINSKNNFYDRKSKDMKIKAKHFFAFEGNTEILYFEPIMKRYNKDILTLIRTGNYGGWSNPIKILELIKGLISGQDPLTTSYEDVEEYLLDQYEKDNVLIKKKHIRKQIDEILTKHNLKIKNIVTEDILEEIISVTNENVKKRFNITKIINIKGIKEYLERRCDFYPDIDKISMIVDRDRGSFTEKNYVKVVETCKALDISLYVTNPCFEFWLLLHLVDELADEEKNKLIKNEKGGNFAFQLLKQYDSSYTKTKINIEKYINNVSKAKTNSLKFQTDLNKLIAQLGTNLGLLFD